MRRRQVYIKGNEASTVTKVEMPPAEKMLEIPKIEKKRGRPKKKEG